MASLKKNLDQFVAAITDAAYEALSFTYQRQRYSDLREQAVLLAHRSPEDINKYLSTRAFRLRQTSGKVHIINPEEIYVINKGGKDENIFECAYMYGSTYYEPPLTLPTANQMREMWSYLLTLPGTTQWLPFQDFFEQKIIEVISALHQYEDMLEEEIVPLEYMMMSSQGVFVHNALYTLVEESLHSLREQVKLYKKGGVPVFMQHELAKKLKLTKQALTIFKKSKPRNA